MVNAMINISQDANKTLNVVKALHGLKDKSEAIELVVKEYYDKLLEPKFRPEFVQRINEAEKGPKKKIADVDKYFGLTG